MNKCLNNLSLEGARIIYRNFRGQATQYNREGSRNFCVVLDDPELVDRLIADGWNVRIRTPREEGEPALNYLQVAVRFDNIPPRVFQITSKRKQELNEDTVGNLDFADITHADLIIHPSPYVLHEGTKNERRGIKAYLKTAYITIDEDEFAYKYAEEEYPQE